MPTRLSASIFLVLVASLPWSAQAAKRDRTLAEMSRSVQVKAAKLDVNSDGILSSEETARGRQKLGFLAGAAAGVVDLNGDGTLTVKEYTQAQMREIVAADENHDGILSMEEQDKQRRALLGKLFRH